MGRAPRSGTMSAKLATQPLNETKMLLSSLPGDPHLLPGEGGRNAPALFPGLHLLAVISIGTLAAMPRGFMQNPGVFRPGRMIFCAASSHSFMILGTKCVLFAMVCSW